MSVHSDILAAVSERCVDEDGHWALDYDHTGISGSTLF